MNDVIKSAIDDNVPANDRSRVIADAEIEPVSIREGVVRVGEGRYQDGTTWYYRGYVLQWNCGRYATKFQSCVGDVDTIREFKRRVNERLAAKKGN